MYGKTAVLGLTTTAALAFTGAPVTGFCLAAVTLIVTGLLLVRFSRRRRSVHAGG
ncbi:MAG: hypothetical protein JO265_00070 [Acidimicrobiia bacterium]|nr:hypothetical protein [Acidimicrobiia bacterium]